MPASSHPSLTGCVSGSSRPVPKSVSSCPQASCAATSQRSRREGCSRRPGRYAFEGYSLHKERQAGVDRLAFRVTNASGAGNIALSATAVVVGQFYHVVVTYDGAQVRLYVNGVLEGQAATSIVLDYGTRPVFIGTSGETVFDGKLNGIADEASIYNRALSADEVAVGVPENACRLQRC